MPIRELNQDTAGVLSLVEHGESLEITNRGKPIARIVPIADGEMDDLVAAGWAAPPSLPRPFSTPAGPVDETNAATNALLELRDEERW